jgi:hypothetical protein
MKITSAERQKRQFPRFDQLEPTAVHHLVIDRRGHRNGPTEMIRPKPRKYVQDVPGRSG